MTSKINVLSLFDGMSCGQIALDRLGIPVGNYFASEIDKHAVTVTKANYPNTIHIGDVRQINADQLPHIDLLFGGAPCTNFSFAGKRKGMVTKSNIEITALDQYLELKTANFEFEGQSYLFWEYVRILQQVKPEYFLLENVKMATKWAKIITSTLGVEPIEINSALVSAQNRPRMYWTNIPGVDQPKDKGIMLREILADEIFEMEPYDEPYRSCKPVPISKPKFNCLRASAGSRTSGIGIERADGFWRKLRPIELERLQTVPEGYTSAVSEPQRRKMLGNGWTVDVICHILQNLKEFSGQCS